MENLEPGYYYHIYNRGNNREKLFYEEWNYSYFMELYEKYIHPIAETYAYCLMGNHFHFLIQTKDLEVLEPNLIDKRPLWRNFADFFNAYAKMINLNYGRTGSLFQERYRRKKVDSENYLQQLIHYIHMNPVKHGLTDRCEDYPYSSYLTILSGKATNLKIEEVISLFHDKKNFIYFHKNHPDVQMIGKFIIDD